MRHTQFFKISSNLRNIYTVKRTVAKRLSGLKQELGENLKVQKYSKFGETFKTYTKSFNWDGSFWSNDGRGATI